MRTRPSVAANDTAVLDLRDRSVARGQNPSATGQSPLEIPRSAKHLVLNLPVGSQEGIYDVSLLTGNGQEVMMATATAELANHDVMLRADVDLPGVARGWYFLGLRRSGFEWTRYRIRVL